MSFLGNTKKAVAAFIPSDAGAPLPVVNQLFDFNIPYTKAAVDGSAAATTSDTLVWSNPFDFTVYVVSAKLTTTGAGITCDNTNFASIQWKTNDGAGGATAVALQVNTTLIDSLANYVANQSRNFTQVTPANTAIPPGGGLWFAITKTASGVVVPVSNFAVRLQKAE
jgi:hypothetical protein